MAAGGAVLGASEARSARKANEAQQAAALAFQKQNTERALRFLKQGYQGSRERMVGAQEAARGDLLASLARGGFSDTSTVGLGAQRAQAMDTRNALAALHSQYQAQRAAALQGQSYPMIQYQSSGAGAALASAGMQMASTAYMADKMFPGQTPTPQTTPQQSLGRPGISL